MVLPDLGRLRLEPSPSSGGEGASGKLPARPPWTHTGMKRWGDDWAGGPSKRKSSNKAPMTDEEREAARQERRDRLAADAIEKAKRADEANVRRLAKEAKARTPAVIQGEIKKKEDELTALRIKTGFAGEETAEEEKKRKELEKKIADLTQEKADKEAALAAARKQMLTSSANTVEELQEEIAVLREELQSLPKGQTDKELEHALEERSWQVHDLKRRQEEENAERDRKNANEKLRARRQKAIEEDSSEGLTNQTDRNWWETDGKRQAAKWRIERCKEEALARRGPPPPPPPPPLAMAPPASATLSKEEREQALNTQLEAMSKLAVQEAKKQHEADEALFAEAGCYTTEDKEEQRARLDRALGKGGASSSSAS